MKKEKMQTVRNVMILTALLVYAYFARFLAKELKNYIVPDTILNLSRTMIHAGITIVWLISVKRRIIQKQVRNYLLAVGVLLLFWQYLKTSKWLFFVTADTITRYMWYSYYIPIILIPLFSFFIAESIGKPESYERPKWMRMFFIPALLLICLILTNDFHRMVFDFPKRMEYASSHYTYQIVYYLTILWVLLLSFYTIFMLLRKCRVPGSRWFQSTPIFVIAGAILLWGIYYLKIVIYDITAFSCMVIILLLESCIQSGLIRSNTGYEGLFQSSTIEAQISDKDFHVCYRSDQAQAVEKETLIHAVNEPVILENKRLSSAKISNGHVFWMDDITELRHYMKELEKTGTELAEQNDLFENALEQTLGELHAIFIKLRISEGKFFLRLQMDCMSQIHMKEEEKWISKGGTISLQNTDGILWVELSMEKGGVTV